MARRVTQGAEGGAARVVSRRMADRHGTAGSVLMADIAMFIEFDAEGLIVRQEGYDCYLPSPAS